MNRKIHVACVAAGAVMVSVLGASAYQSENFDVGPTYTGWTLSSIDVVTNTSSPVHLVKSLSIPVMQWVSNAVPANLTNQVWTDFWTIPTVFNADGSADGPTIDSNATVQFFVNSSSNWTVYSGGDSYVGYKTNSTSTLDVADHATFHQVSVLSDYNTKTFSFFVDDVCLWSDLKFMTTNLSAAQWFQVQNLGGAAANVCYLDEYMLTNRLGGSVLTNPVPGGGVSVADALQYFGTTNNPIPSNTTVATTVNSATFAFASAVSGTQYKVIGCLNPNGTYSDMPNAILNGTNLVASLGDGTNRIFQKVILTSQVDTSVGLTNVYAAYKQTRTSNSWFWVGVPVESPDHLLGGQLGQQLGKGLQSDDKLAIASGGSVAYYHWGGAAWVRDSGPGVQDVSLPAGRGVMIYSSTNGATVLAGLQQTSQVNVTVTNGWNSLAWPYDNGVDWQLPPGSAGDIVYLQRSGQPLPARLVGSVWMQGKYGTGNALTNLPSMQAGDGMLYYRSAAGVTNWTPTRTP